MKKNLAILACKDRINQPNGTSRIIKSTLIKANSISLE